MSVIRAAWTQAARETCGTTCAQKAYPGSESLAFSVFVSPSFYNEMSVGARVRYSVCPTCWGPVDDLSARKRRHIANGQERTRQRQ